MAIAIKAADLKYPLRTQRKRETRRRIIDACITLVSERRENVEFVITLSKVAEIADVHVTTLFTHFESKQQLYSALSEPAIAALESKIGVAQGHVPFFKFLRELQLGFANKVETASETARSNSLFLRSQLDLIPAWLLFEKRQIEMFASYLSHDFDFSPLQARLVAGMIVSANIFSYDRWLQDHSQNDYVSAIEANLRQIESIVRKGFG